jgi:transketolase
MGDQIGVALSGTLYYVPEEEFSRILSLPINSIKKTRLFASLCRINTLYMIARAGSGHIGSSFSSMEIMSWIQLNEIVSGSGNVFFSSKGHDAPGYYNTMIGNGKLSFDLIHQLRQLGGLPGHPDIKTPGIITNTGSLGMGVSKAKGIIFSNRYFKKSPWVFVLTGDGELQEGQFWESLISAANDKLHELIVIIDHNKLQSDTLVSKVSDLGDLNAKLEAFGFCVYRCDGNNLDELSSCINQAKMVVDKPKVIIADTIKGKGVSMMEHTAIDSDIELYKFHSGAPTEDIYKKAIQELINNTNDLLNLENFDALLLETIIRPSINQPANKPKLLVQAYSNALINEAKEHSEIIALDADLILDTGLLPFKKEFPERFIECGIAEQDMVSRAGTMALNKLLPVVHSFSCFLTTRPIEQIYNNSTEHSKIIYVGSLAGLVPAGPGHSHQSVHDVSFMSSIVNITCIEPVSERQVKEALNWAVYSENKCSTYLRLTSVPIEHNNVINDLPLPAFGEGSIIQEGSNAIVFVASPLLAIEVLKATAILSADNLKITVVVMPWLNALSIKWVKPLVEKFNHVFIVENHDYTNSFGTFLTYQISTNNIAGERNFYHKAVKGIPACGKVDEVLAFHKLNAESLADDFRSKLTSKHD